jgi:hypothetical protein
MARNRTRFNRSTGTTIPTSINSSAVDAERLIDWVSDSGRVKTLSLRFGDLTKAVSAMAKAKGFSVK